MNYELGYTDYGDEEDYIDPDSAYEQMREDAGDCMEEMLEELVQKMMTDKTLNTYEYYHNHEEKLLEHMQSTIEFALNKLKKEQNATRRPNGQ